MAADAWVKAEINAFVLEKKQVRLIERFQHPARVSLPEINTSNGSVLLEHEHFTSQSGVAPPTPQEFSAIIYENDAKKTRDIVDELSFIATWATRSSDTPTATIFVKDFPAVQQFGNKAAQPVQQSPLWGILALSLSVMHCPNPPSSRRLHAPGDIEITTATVRALGLSNKLVALAGLFSGPTGVSRIQVQGLQSIHAGTHELSVNELSDHVFRILEMAPESSESFRARSWRHSILLRDLRRLGSYRGPSKVAKIQYGSLPPATDTPAINHCCSAAIKVQKMLEHASNRRPRKPANRLFRDPLFGPIGYDLRHSNTPSGLPDTYMAIAAAWHVNLSWYMTGGIYLIMRPAAARTVWRTHDKVADAATRAA
ncbi:hypothetical protein CPLU01_14252 [Colletotrichum plurivorum]|uniref:Uncharacterized protein n=1 Tax=Colletotrichum plurivorum TaxID=2175906 RepID=A0A8H6JL47_9PEZI|nr:hypothetical protein CPLU01_14252 [Colletotrichum plurivorum]